MIPGLIPFLIGSSGLQLAVVGHTLNSSTANFTYPSGIQAGDIAITIDSAVDTTDYPAAVTPSGFNSKMNSIIADTFGKYNRIVVATRKFTGTVSGTVSGMSHTFSTRKTMLVLRPNWDITIGSSAERSHKTDTGNVSDINISASAFSEPYITLGFKHTDNSGNITSSLSTDYEISASSTAGSLFKWFLNSGEKQNISYDIGDDGLWNFLGGLGIQLS